MDDKIAAKLREQFPPEQIGQLPRGGFKLDYVGHADVTSRLLEADPSWNWEPAASDEHGLPLFDTDSNGKPVGLWIKLTAGGVTRLGYGSCPSNQNDAVKVLIGDALRNAAMRFGVALDLWAKGDRADPTAENATASAGQAARRPPRQQPDANGHQEHPSADASKWMAHFIERIKVAKEEDLAGLQRQIGSAVAAKKIIPAQAADLTQRIQAKRATYQGAPA